MATPATAQTPEKRGIALACGGWATAKAATGATWVMDWHHSTSSFNAYGDDYVPMIRGWREFRTTWPTTSADTAIMIYSQALSFPGHYWLLGNEPNLAEQDNYTPAEAVHVYSSLGRFIKWADPSAKLILGGVLLDTNYMDQVLLLWPPDVPIDGLQWHLYTWDVTPEAAIERAKTRIDIYVDYTYMHNPDWEVWVSEYGMLGTSWYDVAGIAQFIREVTSYLDAHVDRYAWFTYDDVCMTFPSVALVDDAAYVAAFIGD